MCGWTTNPLKSPQSSAAQSQRSGQTCSRSTGQSCQTVNKGNYGGRSSAGTFQYKRINNVELNLQNSGCFDEGLCCCFLQHQRILYAPQQQAVLLSFITEGSQLAPHLQLYQGIGPAALRRHVHQLQVETGRMRKDRVETHGHTIKT